MSSPHHGIFQFANPVINKFQSIFSWRMGDEDENWKSRAFTTLEKRLKKKNDGSYAAFFNVALEHKSPNTPCVTIDRSQDGRLQVSHKKVLPHVMSCRMFRWPDLQTHQELKSVDHCKYPGNHKLNNVCINPYHYSRVNNPVFPPVMTPRVTPITQNSFSLPPVNSPDAGFPIDYYSQAASMSPQSSYNGSPAPYAPSMPGPSVRTQAGYNDMPGMDSNNWYQLNNINDNPFNLNSEIWCKITYWELSSRVGEPFLSSSPILTIDGFTDPTNQNQRFSLGSLSNIKRTKVIEMTRGEINKGVRLERNNSEIWAKNLSEKLVFFHSRNYNCQLDNQFHEQAVIKMPPKSRLKIFDFKVFEEMLIGYMESPQNNYERILSLISHCSIKMSFVKGWGHEYKRHEVTSTPCWLDITLLEPQAYLGNKLRYIQSPTYNITSTS